LKPGNRGHAAVPNPAGYNLVDEVLVLLLSLFSSEEAFLTPWNMAGGMS
jgi:hypothetical protein